MIASSLAGIIWYQAGAAFTFLAAALVTIIVIMYFIFFIPVPSKERTTEI